MARVWACATEGQGVGMCHGGPGCGDARPQEGLCAAAPPPSASCSLSAHTLRSLTCGWQAWGCLHLEGGREGRELTPGRCVLPTVQPRSPRLWGPPRLGAKAPGEKRALHLGHVLWTAAPEAPGRRGLGTGLGDMGFWSVVLSPCVTLQHTVPPCSQQGQRAGGLGSLPLQVGTGHSGSCSGRLG